MAIKIVFGGAPINPTNYPDEASLQKLVTTLKAAGVSTIDTAKIYPNSEETIGTIPSRHDFVIDTKLGGGFVPGSLTKERIPTDIQDSLDKVKIPQFDILYIHAPDPSVPLTEALEAINEAYKKGVFRRFGLSNFTADQVQEVYDINNSKGFVLPTVFQANYNPVARHLETLLFPTLRKLGISIYVYSPIAGGFLTKTKEKIDAGAGRFNTNHFGGRYLKYYNRPSLREALAEWNDIAEKEGVSKAELAYRWVGYNSALKEELGDAVLFGARTIEQIEQTAGSLKKGGLSEEAQKRIEDIWKKVEKEAPVDNYSEQ